MSTHRSQSPPDAAGSDHDQYLTFMLGRETMAMGILAIKEILEYSAPSLVPMTPAHVLGVINLRGGVVPIIDLSLRLGRPSGHPSRRSCIIIVETGSAEGRQVVGTVVDAVNAVIEIPHADIGPPPMFGASVRGDHISGLAKVNGRFVIVLDTSKVLALDDPSSPPDAKPATDNVEVSA